MYYIVAYSKQQSHRLVIFFSALTAPQPSPRQAYWDKTILPCTVQPFRLNVKIRRHTCPPPRGDPVKWAKWAKMGKTGSFEKIFIGREVKIGPWPSLVSCRPKQELNNSGGTLRLKFRILAEFQFSGTPFSCDCCFDSATMYM